MKWSLGYGERISEDDDGRVYRIAGAPGSYSLFVDDIPSGWFATLDEAKRNAVELAVKLMEETA